MHTMSQVISHLTTGESNSVSKGRKTQNFNATTCDLHLTQALFTHSLTRLDLARMPSQGGGSLFRSISPTLKVHSFNSKWMKPSGCGVDADTAYHDNIWPHQQQYIKLIFTKFNMETCN